MIRFVLILLIITVGLGKNVAQHNDRLDTQQVAHKDTFSLARIFTEGHLHGQIRQFSMLTDNAPGLSDYHAIAIGASMQYETRVWRGWQLEMGGDFVNDIRSSDFEEPDPVTGAFDRYDAGLYEVLELDNKNYVARLEDLLVRWSNPKITIVFGKQNLKTPLVNTQDGRMNPTLVEGLYLRSNVLKQVHLEGGWLYRISPRSTNRWFSLSESMGIYAMGVNAAGERNAYRGEVGTNGLLLLNAKVQTPVGQFDAWNYHLENVLNTAFLQWDKNFVLRQNTLTPTLHFGAQAIRQDAVNNGGHRENAYTYAPKGMKSWVFGAYGALSIAQSRFQVNITRITGDGQFLFPREWGREPLFTFLARERNEGLGDVRAISLQYAQKIKHWNGFSYTFGIGHYQLPDVRNYRQNKYGLPSYQQANVEVKYAFGQRLTGLDLTLLVAYKRNRGELHADRRYEINKVNMMNGNLILNYHF